MANRSVNTYQKINTVFFRDTNNIIMPYDELVMPELEYLRNLKFDAEEKIDGTNTRLEITRDIKDNIITWSVTVRGKSDDAVVPKPLLEFINNTYPEDKVLASVGLTKTMDINDMSLMAEKKWALPDPNNPEVFTFYLNRVPLMYTLYGEGYGAGIQKCGGNYQKEQLFIGFDVKVTDANGTSIYLLRENRDEVFNKLGAPIVPYVGQFTIDEAIEYVKTGFKSAIAQNQRDFLAEGLVLRTPCGLKTRMGERIIFKVKTVDFQKYYNKYGTFDRVPQVRPEKDNRL